VSAFSTCLDLRHLQGVFHRTRMISNSCAWTLVDYRRGGDQHRDRVPGDPFPQHHDYVQLCSASLLRRCSGQCCLECCETRHRAEDSGVAGRNGLVDCHVGLGESGSLGARYVALSPYARDMAENMYRALWSWILCVIVTVVVSLLTAPSQPANSRSGVRRNRDTIGGRVAVLSSTLSGPALSQSCLSC